jgi:flap endonuclease-1
MGVDGFFQIKVDDERIMENLGREVKLPELKGEKVCVDASLMIYNSILAMEHLATLTDSEGRTTAHINTIFQKVIQLQKMSIAQIWIFDSPVPNELKRKALEKRAERRRIATEKKYKNHEKIQFRMTKEHVEDIQFLLRKMGICYIVAPAGIEAEQYGAFMTKGPSAERYCKYMISGDSDVLCFGGNLLRVTTKKTSTGKSKKTIYQAYELEEILEELKLTYDQFLQMCVVLGTDFADGTKGTGVRTVVDKIHKHKLEPLTPRQEMTVEYFQSDITTTAEITQEEYDPEAIVAFLKERSFNEDRVRKSLDSYVPKGCD